MFLCVDADFWRSSAAADLSQKLDAQRLIGRAQNVILFLGDGWYAFTHTKISVMAKKYKTGKLIIICN